MQFNSLDINVMGENEERSKFEFEIYNGLEFSKTLAKIIKIRI